MAQGSLAAWSRGEGHSGKAGLWEGLAGGLQRVRGAQRTGSGPRFLGSPVTSSFLCCSASSVSQGGPWGSVTTKVYALWILSEAKTGLRMEGCLLPSPSLLQGPVPSSAPPATHATGLCGQPFLAWLCHGVWREAGGHVTALALLLCGE